MKSNKTLALGSSFRDPSGFVFSKNGEIYRHVNLAYKDNYELLLTSGLYDELVKKHLLIPHSEIDCDQADKTCFKQIKPGQIPFVSYPFEWSFGQLKDAALATLKIQKIAMSRGMSLKDSSGFNIQFLHGKPILIDTLSFEKLDRKKPWAAYRQFCQHFLAPLALASFCDVRMIQNLRIHLDGIPLDLASRLLPKRTWLVPSLLMHIHLHAKTQKKYGSKKIDKNAHSMSKFALEGLISSLLKATKRLSWKRKDTEWGEYYSFTNYGKEAFDEKKVIIEKYLDFLKQKPKTAWDLGANTGLFSRIASNKKIDTISFDIDYLAVEKNYQHSKKSEEKNILPLFLDLTNPSASLGWAHQERDSLEKRAPADLVLALALIHHICISNNVPFSKVAQYFSRLGKNLIIEFVPKQDSNVKKLLQSREDIFDHYKKKHFEKEFEKYFLIQKADPIKDSERTLYLMESRGFVNFEKEL